MRHFASFLALLLLLATAALFVLTTIGVPVKKDWDLIHFNIAANQNSPDTIAQMGVLGVCTHFDQNAAKNCTNPALGFSFPILPGINNDNLDKYRPLSVALVLNPLAAALAGVSAVAWLIGWVLRVRVIALIALLPIVFAMLCSVIAFGVNLAIVLVLRNRIWDISSHAMSGHIGQLFWFSVAGCGTGLSSLICAVQGTRKSDRDYHKSAGTY